jgi:hypothetical protein
VDADVLGRDVDAHYETTLAVATRRTLTVAGSARVLVGEQRSW